MPDREIIEQFDSLEDLDKYLNKSKGQTGGGRKVVQEFDSKKDLDKFLKKQDDTDWIGKTIFGTVGGITGAVVGAPIPGGSAVLGTVGAGLGGMFGEFVEDMMEGDKPDGILNAGLSTAVSGGLGIGGLGVLTKGLSTVGQLFLKRNVRNKFTAKALKEARDKLDADEYQKLVDKIRKTAKKKKLSEKETDDLILKETGKTRRKKSLTREQIQTAKDKGNKAADKAGGLLLGTAGGGLGQLGNAAISSTIGNGPQWDMDTGKTQPKGLLSGY